MWNRQRGRTDWEQEIDDLMRRQMTSLSYSDRKQLYDRVQRLIADNLPIICIASPHILAAANARVRGLAPAGLRPYMLWNAEMLYFEQGAP
jgi:peptide/nickel transport system substrate-binding protein